MILYNTIRYTAQSSICTTLAQDFNKGYTRIPKVYLQTSDGAVEVDFASHLVAMGLIFEFQDLAQKDILKIAC